MVLVTLIFLLADGTPARYARVSCPQIPMYLSGDDKASLITDANLLIDARGATIVTTEPGPLSCTARQSGQTWAGDLEITEKTRVFRLTLKE